MDTGSCERCNEKIDIDTSRWHFIDLVLRPVFFNALRHFDIFLKKKNKKTFARCKSYITILFHSANIYEEFLLFLFVGRISTK